MILGFLDYLKTKEVEFTENKRLSELSSVGIGGEAALVVRPKSRSELLLVMEYLDGLCIDYKVVGGCTNILFPDGRTERIIVKASGLSGFSVNGRTVIADSGVSLSVLSRLLARGGLSGIEELSGIPGTVGGATVGNAGAYGREIGELIESADVYDREVYRVVTLSRDELGFGYRTSLLKSGKFVLLSVNLKITESQSDICLERIREITKTRQSTQPREPSLGSTFKRPKNGYASRMIDLCGLKGALRGGAKISEKHAGFIVNVGGATAKDYLCLASFARDEVLRKFGVLLEYEIDVF
jgi:UDP-N-acetylmuramate dehydrogenase